MTHPGGRPTKYSAKILQQVDEYLALTGKHQGKLPTIFGLAVYVGVDSDTLLNWSKATDQNGDLLYPEFFGSFKKLKDIQGQQLVDDGIYGGKEVNPTIVKLLLQNNHGMKERQDITTNDKDLPTPIYNGKSTKV